MIAMTSSLSADDSNQAVCSLLALHRPSHHGKDVTHRAQSPSSPSSLIVHKESSNTATSVARDECTRRFDDQVHLVSPPWSPLPSQTLPSSVASASSLRASSSNKSPLMLPHRSSFWQTVLSTSSPTSIYDAPTCVPATKPASASNSVPSSSACAHPCPPLPVPSHDITVNPCQRFVPEVTNSVAVRASSYALSGERDTRHGEFEQVLSSGEENGVVNRDEKGNQNANPLDSSQACGVAEMNVKCDVCGVSFRKQGHLNMHWRSVHGRDYSQTSSVLPTPTPLQSGINCTQSILENHGNSSERPCTTLPLGVSLLSSRQPTHMDSLSTAPLASYNYNSAGATCDQMGSTVSVPGVLSGTGINGDGYTKIQVKNGLRSSSPTSSPRVALKSSSNDANDINVDEKHHGSDNGVSGRSSERGTGEGRISKASRAYSCPQCGACFRRGSDRNRHMRMVHAKIRPFECELCRKHFGRKSFLEAHVLTVHHKMRPFQCECGAAFGQRSSLTRHSRKIHGREPS